MTTDTNTDFLELLDVQATKMLLKHYETQYNEAYQRIKPYHEVLEKSAHLIQLLREKIGEEPFKGLSTIPRPINGITVDDASKNGHGGYDPDSTRFKNALAAIQQAGKVLSPRQIVEIWRTFRPNWLTDNADLQSEVNSVSATLRPKADEAKEILRVRSSTGEFYYGKLDWFNSNGMPRKEYAPNGVTFV